MRGVLIGLVVMLLAAATWAQPADFSSAGHVEVSTAANFASVEPGQQAVVAVVLDVEEGWHAQSSEPLTDNLIAFEVKAEGDGFAAFDPVYAEAKIANYPAISPETDGDVSVYDGRTVHYLPVQIADDAGESVTIAGTVRVQVCDDQSCKAPANVPWSVTLPVGDSVPAADQAPFDSWDPAAWAELLPAAPSSAFVADANQAGDFLGLDFDLADAGPPLVLSLAFVAGVFFNAVPCVLPVLPLKIVSFYESAKHSRARCAANGLAFGAGIVLAFAALATLIFVFKAVTWGSLFSNVYFSAAVVLVLVVAAAYQFGLLTFVLPAKVYGTDAAAGNAGGVLGNVGFGVFTAVLSTPCTFGLFLALLVWAAAQPAWLGVVAVTVVGVGMASPYVLLSLFPGVVRRFPRTGAWSELVKQATGFVLLAVAAYFARPLLGELRGPWVWWVVWGCVAAAGVYLVVGAAKIGGRRGILVSGVVAAVLAFGTLPLAYRLANPPAGWVKFADFEEADRPYLVKFTADWCANCQTIEQRVFGTQDQMDAWRDAGLTLVKADLTDPDAPGWALLADLNPARAIPFTAVYLPGREEPVGLPGIYGSGDVRGVLK